MLLLVIETHSRGTGSPLGKPVRRLTVDGFVFTKGAASGDPGTVEWSVRRGLVSRHFKNTLRRQRLGNPRH